MDMFRIVNWTRSGNCLENLSGFPFIFSSSTFCWYPAITVSFTLQLSTFVEIEATLWLELKGSMFCKNRGNYIFSPFLYVLNWSSLNLLPHGRFGVKILLEWLQESHLSLCRYTSRSSERFIKKDNVVTCNLLKLLTVCSLPGRNSNVLLSVLPAEYQLWGKDTENLMNLRKAVQASLLEEPWGKGKQTRRKHSHKLHCPQRWHLQRTMAGLWRCVIFLYTFTYRAHFITIAGHSQGKGEEIWSEVKNSRERELWLS